MTEPMFESAGTWRRLRISLAAMALLVSGCAQQLQALPQGGEYPGRGSWVTLTGDPVLQAAPGMRVSLPNGPYRARFADANGVYFASTLKLEVQTSWGGREYLQGGVYLRHEEPTQGWIWTDTALGPRLLEQGIRVPVQLHTPR